MTRMDIEGEAPRGRRDRRGQSLVEFALILPILLMLVGGIVQYGMIFATKHSLIQVGRDVGRWAATQPCSALDSGGNAQPVTQADLVARQSRLMGYSIGDWSDSATTFKAYPIGTPLPPTRPAGLATQSVEVAWTSDKGVCPPTSSANDVWWVTIRLSHRAPVVLPGFPYLPGLGTCDSNGCYFVVTTTAEFRMEPVPAP
ncbi:MAG TPA: TadE/TadG family type IV pilus assembly protein [Gemmatimonadales bacterium]|nr:TadE/TadG family type IV pilus assembly protein [Gemmatimonadales bacterium]